MPWPGFTEFTFGFAFLREFEHNCVPGGFPKVPDFISQHVEATKGYDVEITLANARPVFLQFKRSKVMVGSKAKEIKRHYFTGPKVYRMKLHKNGQYRQHKALQKLETQGNAVFYVTSQIYSSKEFANAYSTGTIVSKASAIFSPKEIILPNDTEHYHVGFQSNSSIGYVCFSEPSQFERKFATADSWLKHLFERRQSAEANLEFFERPQSAKDNLESLKKAVEYLKAQLSSDSPIHEMLEERDEKRDIIVQASILAYFQLDTILTFVKFKE